MSIGAMICIILAIFFLALASTFALLKEKSAMLISGFNTLPKERRGLYDQKKMSLDYRNMIAFWSALFFIGALLSQSIHAYSTILTFIIWPIWLSKEIHLDADKSLAKYKIRK